MQLAWEISKRNWSFQSSLTSAISQASVRHGRIAHTIGLLRQMATGSLRVMRREREVV